MSEAREVLREYLRVIKSLKKPPERQSNKRFRGQVFASIFCEHLSKYVPHCDVVLGPIWIKGLEWIEWDCAIVKRAPVRYRLYDPDKVVALFECKVSGIYGGRDKLPIILENIRGKFKEAEKLGIRCFYVSLMEAKPRSEKSIDYYKETKKTLEGKAFILFNSRSVKSEDNRDVEGLVRDSEEFEGEWDALIKEVLRLIR